MCAYAIHAFARMLYCAHFVLLVYNAGAMALLLGKAPATAWSGECLPKARTYQMPPVTAGSVYAAT